MAVACNKNNKRSGDGDRKIRGEPGYAADCRYHVES